VLEERVDARGKQASTLLVVLGALDDGQRGEEKTILRADTLEVSFETGHC
jgi:hypothetical protein